MLINFVTKCTIPKEKPEEENPMLNDLENQWMMYMDEDSNANSSRAGLTLISLEEWDI